MPQTAIEPDPDPCGDCGFYHATSEPCPGEHLSTAAQVMGAPQSDDPPANHQEYALF